MRSLLFFPDVAEALNKKVMKNIAPHLFISCNYTPDRVKIFSTDAQFICGVMNLYKFAYDSSIVNSIGKLIKRNRLQCDDNGLKECLDIVQMLRTVTSHNVSEKNGTGDMQKKYDQWLEYAIQKKDISCAEDYEKAVEALELLGEELGNIIRYFVNQASHCQDKENLIKAWEEIIFEFYKKQNNERIFQGQMREAYLSRSCRNINERQINRKIARWCKNYYLQRYEDLIYYYQDILARTQQKLSLKELEQIRDAIRNLRNNLEEINQKVADAVRHGDVTTLNDFSYKDYYFMNLDSALREILGEIKSSGDGSMLPEDLMQRLIERDFEGIRSDDFF